MSQNSQKRLVKLLSGMAPLQSVVAASFDESASVFGALTEGSKFHLIALPDKLIGRLDHDQKM